jgi:hypothetical protein
MSFFDNIASQQRYGIPFDDSNPFHIDVDGLNFAEMSV